jgi:uncharacterized repeat protein (TIGR03803 family)
MDTPGFRASASRRRALLLCVSLAFAGCSAAGAPSAGVPAGLPQGMSGRLLPGGSAKQHSLRPSPDGAIPYGGVTYLGGTLYGTTRMGGTNNTGTVYSITPAGAETVLYSFALGSFDGANPFSDLTAVGGTLRGTTLSGGLPGGFGTVFKITTSGTETVSYIFRGPFADGSGPLGRLVKLGGTLYGTTISGGTYNLGTVYQISSAGVESVLYSFQNASDGYSPWSGLIKVGGTLYGTTYQGGANGAGTVYSMTTAGVKTILHSFQSAVDGVPRGDLLKVGGALYGTTQGTLSNLGTVYKIALPGGAYTLLHTFVGGTDGMYPLAKLTNVGGLLYGTTSYGGSPALNQGTVFTITPSGTEHVIYAFGSGTDGTEPSSHLTYVGGLLYGTTLLGGTNNRGTVYTITPSGTETVIHNF